MVEEVLRSCVYKAETDNFQPLPSHISLLYYHWRCCCKDGVSNMASDSSLANVQSEKQFQFDLETPGFEQFESQWYEEK